MGKIGGRNKSQDRQKPAQWERARQRIMGGHLSSQARRNRSGADTQGCAHLELGFRSAG